MNIMDWMRRILLGMIWMALMAFSSVAQTFQENILYGDEAMGERDFYGAAMYYRNAMYLDSSSMRATWKYAEACRQFNNYLEAEKFYAIVVRADNTQKYLAGHDAKVQWIL
jgi:hypothetical protein